MAADTLHDRALVAHAAEPAQAASAFVIAQVYDAHFEFVYRCLRGLGVRNDLLDDALQDTFMVVQHKLPAFDGRAQLRTWLYAIVLRVARRYRERAAKDATRFVASEPACAVAGEEALEQNEQLTLARRALDALDAVKREVFVLAMIEQMSAPEIAEILAVPVNTVYSRLRAARAAFTEQVAGIQRGRPVRRCP